MRPGIYCSVAGGKIMLRSGGKCRLILAGCALLLGGCEEEPRHGAAKPSSAQKRADSGPIIGQRTQKIVETAPALAKGDARVASTKIVAKDPITLQGNAYVSIIGRSVATDDRARCGPFPRCKRPISQRS